MARKVKLTPEAVKVVNRLRKSKTERDAELLDDGMRAGEEWAREYAEYDELERLAKLVDDDHLDLVLDTSESVYTVDEKLYFATHHNGDHLCRSAAREFWGEAIPEDDHDKLRHVAWLRGFATAAASVFDQFSEHV